MEDTGIVRLPGSLDPRAQEFKPTNSLTFFHTLIYSPYPCLPYTSGERQVTLFAAPPPAFVRTTGAQPPLPPALPPPSPSPSRTLLLSSVPTDVSESSMRRELEVFGDVRAVEMERVRNGIVTVHFYDVRHAQSALVEIQEQHMQHQCRLRRHFDTLLVQNNSSFSPVDLISPPLPPPARGLISGRAVWAQFTIPVTGSLPEGHNQGTLVIFNLESDVSTNSLKEIFEAFGAVKELRETPFKQEQKFVEFYDIRAAAKALSAMNGKEIWGKKMVIEFSRPGGHCKRFFNTTNRFTTSPYLSPLPRPRPPLCRKSTCGVRSRGYVSSTPRCNNSNKKMSLNGTGNRIQTSMSCLSLKGSYHEDQANYRTSQPKNNNSRKSSTPNTKQKQEESKSSGSRGWKGWRKTGKEYDPRFLIDEDAIVESNPTDTRTTLMIKNIPNKYSQQLLLNMLDNHCIHCNEQIANGGDHQQQQPFSSYDFVYLPIDFMNKCNVGYGFVNMTSPEATLRLYKAFHFQNWEVFNSRKICQVTYARLQGVEALKEHFKNSKFPCETEEYLPVVFSPPRDGRLLTQPVPIVSRSLIPINDPTAQRDHVNYNHDEDDVDTVYSTGGSNSSSSATLNGADIIGQQENP